MNYSVTYKNFTAAANALKMFELRKLVSISIMEGNFRNARIAQKEFSKAAIEDFDTFKTLPNITITNVPLREWFVVGFRSLEYKIYKFFTGKSKEEKLFYKMVKQAQKPLPRTTATAAMSAAAAAATVTTTAAGR